MATEKRKAVVADRPAKKIKFDDNGKAKVVKAKSDPSTDQPKRKSKDSDVEPQRRPSKPSILSTEERAFPRGGASVLTPLEQRQIRADAERDVLFEESGKSKVVRDEYGEETEEKPDTIVAAKKRRKGKKSKDVSAAAEDEAVKVLGLGYRTLAVGSLVLGQVTSITTKDVALALPNNLTGYIPITAISGGINQRIQAMLEEEEEDKAQIDGPESDGGAEDIDLAKLFRVGQYLRAYVTATSSESAKGSSKSKRRIELSVDPRLANSGLKADSLEANYMVQASVKSVEDHGMVADLGFEDESVRGFISKKELGQQWKIDEVQQGQVMLCCVTGFASDNGVVKLCPDPLRISDLSKHILKEAATIDPFIPGTAVEMLITSITGGGIAGKIMGTIDATADSVHSGAGTNQEAFAKLKVGQKVQARVIFNFQDAESKKVAVSLLDHVRKFEEQAKAMKKRRLHDSEIIEKAVVTKVMPGVGLFFEVGLPGQYGYAHISRLSGGKVEALFEGTGPFALQSTHCARVLSYNPVDGVYNLSLEQSILDRKYLKLDDVKIGSLVEGKIDRLIVGEKGVTGIVVTLEEGITALVPEMHFADVKLQHPEKRFREGLPVKARVLNVDPEKRQIRLTLKKTLVNTDAAIWKSHAEIQVGDESPGTIIKIQANGAVVQFYGRLRGWLPVSQMSEAYVKDATEHFRVGQTVNVHAKEVDPKENEMIVSCRTTSVSDEAQEASWKIVKPGEIVAGRVSEVAKDAITVVVEGTDIRGTLRIAHLTDGSEEKSQKLGQQLRVGQKLSEVLVLQKRETQRTVIFSNKPSLISDAKAGRAISNLSDVKMGAQLHGYVRNVTPDGIFVEFAAAIVGYIPKSQITKEKLSLPAFGFRKDMSITARVIHVDLDQQRFTLTLKEDRKPESSKMPLTALDMALVNPVDEELSSLNDLTLGKQIKARITSVKDTQLNVALSDNIQGRIDVSEAFTSWDEINDHKRPLSKFKAKQILFVKVLGVHDARNHRFLPITHRQSRVPVFELTAKTGQQLSTEADILTLGAIEVGSSWVAFVNNISEGCLWVNLSPNVRGRIDLMDLTDDASRLQNVPKYFPVGSALKVKVKSKTIESNRLDLVAAAASSSAPQTLEDLVVGESLAGKVIRVTERSVLVALSDSVSGVISLTDISDDYDEASTSRFSRNDIIRVFVVEVDLPNRRVFLSTRQSKVLSSSLRVADPLITSLSQLKPTDVIRGFVKVVRSNGVIIALGPRVEAFVRISDLSDSYIKDWQAAFQIDQLVKGKILAVDAALNHVQMSLKGSHVDQDYVPPRKLEDLTEGEIVTGKVRKVEDFGVFIDVDDTSPKVSGLCHRSQIADRKVGDVKGLYDEGDLVKAKILSLDIDKRRISFGLKASYFQASDDVDMKDQGSDAESDPAEESDQSGVALDMESDEMSIDGGIDLTAVRDVSNGDSDIEDSASEMSVDDAAPLQTKSAGLKTTGFSWTGEPRHHPDPADDSDVSSTISGPAASAKQHKKSAQRDRAPIFTDRTGDLDSAGPQTPADFERLLLSAPHDSSLWVGYMALHLRLAEVALARAIGWRAIRTIGAREESERMGVWVALLNLEVAYGGDAAAGDAAQGDSGAGGDPDAAVENVFREACAVQDPYAVHVHLAEIYTAAGQLDKVDRVYESMVAANVAGAPVVATEKLRKQFRAMPRLWLAYATFLFERRRDAGRARALLPRALQSVLDREKRDVMTRFAGMEFRFDAGDPERGRTVFEGIVEQYPRKNEVWDAWVEGEMAVLKRVEQAGDDEDGVPDSGDKKAKKGKQGRNGSIGGAGGREAEVKEQVERIRTLFERMTKNKVKTKRAKTLFKRWREFEEKHGSERDVERVVGLAKEWVENARQSKEGVDDED